MGQIWEWNSDILASFLLDVATYEERLSFTVCLDIKSLLKIHVHCSCICKPFDVMEISIGKPCQSWNFITIFGG